ncbi:MAG TPA: hypothetical protein PLY70_11085 [Saprospiraceae bacterium]|nr:hypothetical protein [Saprospiraceae bacterium]
MKITFLTFFCLSIIACRNNGITNIQESSIADTTTINSKNIVEENSQNNSNIKHNVASLHDTVFQRMEIYYPRIKQIDYVVNGIPYTLLLTQNNDDVLKTGNLTDYHSHIIAFALNLSQDTLLKAWKMQDMLKRQKDSDALENNIYWIKKYCEAVDLNGDSNDELFLVYATEGNNNISDGRLNIMTYYNDQKHFIRHQNGVLDFERNMQVDKSIYKLPFEIKTKLKAILTEISSEDIAILPYGWQDQFDKGVLNIKE